MHTSRSKVNKSISCQKRCKFVLNAILNARCKIENYSKKETKVVFVHQITSCHLLYLDGIKDSAIRLNIKSKTQDNKNTFIQQKEAKRKASSRKQKLKLFKKLT